MAKEVTLENLLNTIRIVQQQHADDLCWMDIDLIFQAAGLPILDRKVGDKFCMLKNCTRYIDTMCKGGTWKSYEELEQENKILRKDLAELEQAIQERRL